MIIRQAPKPAKNQWQKEIDKYIKEKGVTVIEHKTTPKRVPNYDVKAVERVAGYALTAAIVGYCNSHDVLLLADISKPRRSTIKASCERQVANQMLRRVSGIVDGVSKVIGYKKREITK